MVRARTRSFVILISNLYGLPNSYPGAPMWQKLGRTGPSMGVPHTERCSQPENDCESHRNQRKGLCMRKGDRTEAGRLIKIPWETHVGNFLHGGHMFLI